MDDDGVQANCMQLLQSKAELLEMVGENGTADLDDGELVW